MSDKRGFNDDRWRRAVPPSIRRLHFGINKSEFQPPPIITSVALFDSSLCLFGEEQVRVWYVVGGGNDQVTA